MKTLQLNFRIHVIVYGIIMSLLLFTACSEDDDVAPSVDFTGSYLVEESDPDDNYTLIIEKHASKRGFLQIRNFGGFMNIPIDAKASGNTLKIPSQTFNQRTKELTLSGTASFVSDTLLIDYQVRGFTEFDSQDKAIRK